MWHVVRFATCNRRFGTVMATSSCSSRVLELKSRSSDIKRNRRNVGMCFLMDAICTHACSCSRLTTCRGRRVCLTNLPRICAADFLDLHDHRNERHSSQFTRFATPSEKTALYCASGVRFLDIVSIAWLQTIPRDMHKSIWKCPTRRLFSIDESLDRLG